MGKEKVEQVHARLVGRVAEMWQELMATGYQYSSDLLREMVRAYYDVKFRKGGEKGEKGNPSGDP